MELERDADDQRSRGDAAVVGRRVLHPGQLQHHPRRHRHGGDGNAPGHFFGTTYVRNAQGQILDDAWAADRRRQRQDRGHPATGPRAVIGNPNPRAFFSVANDVTLLRRWTLRAQVDGVRGVDVFNFDRRCSRRPRSARAPSTRASSRARCRAATSRPDAASSRSTSRRATS
jgi:hypothetical protein